MYADSKTWLDNADKVGTIVIAIFVASIGAFQWFTAREKLRLDLYNRRFDVYSRTIDFVQAMTEWVSVERSEQKQKHRDFIKAVRESQFLFASDPSILKLLDEMNTNAFVVKGFWEEISPRMDQLGPDYLPLYEKKQTALESIMAAVGPLEQKLAPFFAFRQQRFRRLKLNPLKWAKQD